MSKMWLAGGAAFVGLLLIVSVVLALTQRENVLPEGTPGRTVQLFLKAMEDEDFKLAYSLLGEKLSGECAVEDIASSAFYSVRELEQSRVTLEDTIPLNGSAIVVARVTQIRGSGPFGTSESSHEVRFTLGKEDGRWRLTRNPWPYRGCADPARRPPDLAPAVAPLTERERESTTTTRPAAGPQD